LLQQPFFLVDKQNGLLTQELFDTFLKQQHFVADTKKQAMQQKFKQNS
jgi:hypothetical protein